MSSYHKEVMNLFDGFCARKRMEKAAQEVVMETTRAEMEWEERGHSMELYVKKTSNCPDGFPLSRFKILSPTWEGEAVIIPFGEEVGRDFFQVVGWTDLFMGTPCPVKIARARTPRGEEGFLVWGGNSGLRVLDDRREPESWEAHLPAGWGMPIIWIDDLEDLPEDVRRVIQ